MKKILAFLLVLAMVLPTCAFAQAEVTAEQAAALSKWADDLYEPETSITYAATIAWPTDATAVETADKAVRPNTMFVTIDKDLKVYAMSGEELGDLAAYLAAVKDTTLAALYINDQETADAFNAFAAQYAVADVFAVATPENAQFIKAICDANAGILGIIDWTDATLTTERADLVKIVQQTNGAHAKIAIIPESIATYDAVEYLRGMLTTVWAKTTADAKAIYTQITNGVNGIVCSDYEAVAAAITSVNDVTTLMRHVYITGHRGMPGTGYIENTIRSGRGAIEAGANVIECDIGLSSDGVLFVLHDDTTTRLFNRPEGEWAESLTIAELTSFVFDVTDDTKENAPNSVLNANNTNRTTAGREDYVLDYDPAVDRIPTLEEYWTELDDEDVIHFIEIKSYQPAIVEPLKKLAKEMALEDRMCVITFNDGVNHWGDGSVNPEQDVMKAMFEQWPEMSLGYLGGGKYNWGDLDAVEAEKGMGAAVGQLYSYLQPYNSTCNDYNSMAYLDVIFAARHRGLTAWHWTYNTEAQFADHYLNGGTYSMTTNFANWASNWAVKVEAEDQTLANGDALAVKVIAQNGAELAEAGKLSLVPVSGVAVSLEDGKLVASEAGEAVVMVRLDAKLDVNGVDVSETTATEYAIYSNPITITVK